jgi:hypothetical protein
MYGTPMALRYFNTDFSTWSLHNCDTLHELLKLNNHVIVTPENMGSYRSITLPHAITHATSIVARKTLLRVVILPIHCSYFKDILCPKHPRASDVIRCNIRTLLNSFATYYGNQNPHTGDLIEDTGLLFRKVVYTYPQRIIRI